MYKLKRLCLDKFRSFSSPQVFDFVGRPSLNFLTGRNDLFPRLEANGVGKSTVWDGMCWAFFDKTPKALKATDISPWGHTKGASVCWEYEFNNVPYELRRTWSPNTWTLTTDGQHKETLTADTSNPALAHLGLDFDTLLQCVLMSQGREMFLDLKPEAMSTLFSRVLRLDHWVDLSTSASKQASIQDSQSRVLESDLARAEGQLEQLLREDHTEAFKDWEKKRDDAVTALEASHAQHLKEFEQCKKGIQDTEAKLGALMDQIKDVEKECDHLRQQEIEANKERHSVQVQSRVLESQIDALARKADQHEKSHQCDACGRAWDSHSKDKHLNQLHTEIDRLEDQLKELAVADVDRLFDQLCDRVTRKVEQLNSLKTLERQLAAQHTELRRSKFATEAQLDSIESQCEALLNQQNPASMALEKHRKGVATLQARVDDLRGQLHDSHRRHTLKQFWVRGFKDIRLQQISEALNQLEIEVNSSLDSLGLQGWRVLFDSESETKSGNIKRGFSVQVLSPDNDGPAPWGSWSGGEAQRLRIAGNMGLSNLIRSRLGVGLPLEVWDEPTQYLSQSGVKDLLDCLKQRSIDLQREIWIVDHRSLGYGAFDFQVRVVKDKKGSRIEKFNV